jgi:hypothetical protein
MQMTGLPAASSALGEAGGISRQPPHILHHSNSISSMDGYQIDNPMPHRLPEGENATPLEVIGTTASDKLVIIMVGLPATGTSFFFMHRPCILCVPAVVSFFFLLQFFLAVQWKEFEEYSV